MSRSLKETLTAGKFAITAELAPPQGTDIEHIRERASHLKGIVDGVNITDNPSAVVRMSSLATALVAKEEGLEPVWQMTCRDRNRIAMQSEILGAAGLGIKNLLCLSGDHTIFGNHPGAKAVYDIDSTQQIAMVHRMREEHCFLDEDKPFKGEVDLFIGGAANPFAEPYEFRPLRLQKKVMAGLDFVQTQCIFDMDLFRRWLRAVRDLGVDQSCHILAGIIPLKSPGMARFMASKVAGVVIPDAIIKRMESVPQKDAAKEGIKICCEQIQELKEMKGIHGIHLMAIGWEHRVAEILEQANLNS
jgi:methylenetetrahydrofolate reductase (NADPH)